MFSQRSHAAQNAGDTAHLHNEELMKVVVFRVVLGVVLAVTGALAAPVPARAQAQERAHIETNEAYVKDVLRESKVDTADPMSVFSHVFQALPDRVDVLPTENYFYFRFYAGGIAWAGSIRLGPAERANGGLEFGFYKDLSDWAEEMSGAHREILGAAQGVSVVEETPLRYRVTASGRTVVFALNDLSSVQPPPQTLHPSERFLGPIFDESGLRFFLVYNRAAKVFHYVLDETVPVPDDLVDVKEAPRIAIGRRTGFAFYRDHLRERRILVGVNEINSRLNTWFDGPFDQLPENFIKGEELREAILDADPSAKGEIDRLGNYLKEEGRYLIHPYMLYRKAADLLRVNTCAIQRQKRPDLYAKCFDIEPDPSTFGPPPMAKGQKK